MRLLSADDVLGAQDFTVEPVEVPEWGGQIYVRTLSAAQRDLYEQQFVNMKTGKRIGTIKNIRARLVVLAACNQDGEAMFTEKQIDQVGAKSAAAVDRVFDAAAKLNGLTADDVEELAGN